MPLTISQWKDKERREGPRVRLRLGLVLVYPQRPGRPARSMFYGKTDDVGLSGLSMVVDENVFEEGEVAVVLALPLAYPGAARKVVMSTAEISYAIHSTKLDAYRVGLAFREFRGDGRALLEAALRQASQEERDDGARDPGVRSAALLPKDSQPLGW